MVAGNIFFLKKRNFRLKIHLKINLKFAFLSGVGGGGALNYIFAGGWEDLTSYLISYENSEWSARGNLTLEID